MTVENIYKKVIDKSTSKEMGIKLIENYGLQQQRFGVTKLLEDTTVSDYVEINKAIERISGKLDKLLEKTTEAYKK